jgi:hypothetical protein
VRVSKEMFAKTNAKADVFATAHRLTESGLCGTIRAYGWTRHSHTHVSMVFTAALTLYYNILQNLIVLQAW